MKHSSQLRPVRVLVCALFSLVPAGLFAGTVTPAAVQGGVSWQVPAPNGGISLRVKMPDGSVSEQQYAAGQAPSFMPQRGVLADGLYTWEIVTSPIVSAELRAKAQQARDNGQTIEMPAGSVESGTFRVLNGAVIMPDASAVEPSAPRASGATATTRQSNAPIVPNDQVINDDLIVIGSIGVGFDSTNGQNFGFDTIILKENNLRILFDDTSNTASFPKRDWRLVANDTTNGGQERFSIEDVTAGRTVFTILGNAPSNAMVLDSNGDLGLGTANPVVDLHVVSGNTPTMRLEQNGSSGFTAQTWDVAGNETNFFIRDATTGSRLPFRIQPGAATNSLFIAGTGNVGLGTSSPAGKLHTSGAGAQLVIFQSSDDQPVQFRMQTNSTNRRIVALNTAGAQQGQLVFNDGGAFDFLGAAAGDQRLTILSSGNVGIGTSAPTQRLSVNGTAGKPGGGSWDVFSDERLKNIKGEFTSGLDRVLQLQPVRYEYKADNALGLVSEGEHVGFGAEAMRKVIPEAVTENSAGYLMINNDPILWTMLNAIKEQNAQIEDLKEQVKRLQAEVVLNAEHRKPARKKVAVRNR